MSPEPVSAWEGVIELLARRMRKLLSLPGAFLIIEDSRRECFAQCKSLSENDLLCETIGNRLLPPGRKLSHENKALLREMKFRRPSLGPRRPNFSRLWSVPERGDVEATCEEAAGVCVRALRDVYRVTPDGLDWRSEPGGITHDWAGE